MNDSGPSWEELELLSGTQGGLFSSSQARDAGFSPQLLDLHLKNGRLERLHRGIYRLTRFPTGDQEELLLVWLWSEQEGRFSHRTALFLHELSDALPSKIDISLPASWRRRTRQPPAPLRLHYTDTVTPDWVGSVPVSSPALALAESIQDGLGLELAEQAVREGLNRGLFSLLEILPALRQINLGVENGSNL
jgi:hypothetical protein